MTEAEAAIVRAAWESASDLHAYSSISREDSDHLRDLFILRYNPEKVCEYSVVCLSTGKCDRSCKCTGS